MLKNAIIYIQSWFQLMTTRTRVFFKKLLLRSTLIHINRSCLHHTHPRFHIAHQLCYLHAMKSFLGPNKCKRNNEKCYIKQHGTSGMLTAMFYLDQFKSNVSKIS